MNDKINHGPSGYSHCARRMESFNEHSALSQDMVLIKEKVSGIEQEF